MERSHFVLAAMAPAGTAGFSRVQIQKTLFLLDQNIGELTGGPHFSFKPHYYGPFDAEVYRALEALERDGFVDISHDPRLPSPLYSLTSEGLNEGRRELATLSPHVQEYIRNTVSFVRSVSFAELVTAIYREYPEMAENSVVARRDPVAPAINPR